MLCVIIFHPFDYFNTFLYENLSSYRRFTRFREIVSNDSLGYLTESDSFIVQVVTVQN
jgi:hypothetical protein